MNLDKVNSDRLEVKNFEFVLARSCTHEELKHSIAKALEISESQVMIYSSTGISVNYDNVAVIVHKYDAGFRTHIEIYNYLNPQNPLPYLKQICMTLQTSLLIDAREHYPTWVFCTPEGNFSYVNADEINDEDDYLTLSAASPCRPFCSMTDSHLKN